MTELLLLKVDNLINSINHVSLEEQYCFVERVIHLIKLYHCLDIENNSQHADTLLDYCDEKYIDDCSLLDDCIQMVTKFQTSMQLEMIFNQYITTNCDIKQCKSFIRQNMQNKNVVEDKNLMFYANLLDSMHCYLYHTWDLGMRVRQSEIQHNDTKENYVFSNMRNSIVTRKKGLINIFGKKINRFETSKFNIITSNDDAEASNTCTTFMDTLYAQIDINISWDLEDEQYDTDAIQMELEEKNTANIQMFLTHDKSQYQMICNLVHEMWIQSQRCDFSIGYLFHYWNSIQPKYEHLANIIDNHGYTLQDLYVAAKYDSIKEEILCNQIFSIPSNEYKSYQTKATKYMKAKEVKNMKSAKSAERRLHYGIAASSPVTEEHVLSVILYCDQTDLCYKFSETFRKNHLFEPLKSVKLRNCEYAHFSRLLRETVEYYGHRGEGDKMKVEMNGKKKNAWCNQTSGPFYCGMSKVMAMPSFNVRLCGPTSTSRHIEVATRFADDNGMVMQFNNNWHCNADQLRIFGCNWISKYKEEDEYLLIGGQYQIRVESIRTWTDNSV
eukprot:431122_1